MMQQPALRDTSSSIESQAAFAKMIADREARQAARPAIEQEGKTALMRLFTIAQGDSGQCRHVVAFLLGLYNGSRFKFDLTDFRAVDGEIFDDFIAVLKMDSQPQQEIHTYFVDGGTRFEQLAKDWGLKDHLVSATPD